MNEYPSASDESSLSLSANLAGGAAAQLKSILSDIVTTHEIALWKFAVMAEMRQVDTFSHMMRVGQISGFLAMALTGDYCFADVLCRAAPHHDIGKLCIADTVVRKAGSLDAADWEEMRMHPTLGAKLLQWTGNELFTTAQEVALHHHERFDGSGYPHGLAGADIPMGARIVAIADYIDAVTLDRPYRLAVPADQAFQAVQSLSGNHFDPDVARVALAHRDDILRLKKIVDQKFSNRRVADMDYRVFRPIF